MALLRKLVESAWVEYLKSEVAGLNAVAGVSDLDKTAPCTICSAVSADDQDGTGTYAVRVQITTKGSLDSGADAFDTLCTSVNTAINAADILTELAAHAAGLAVRGVGVDDKYEWGSEDDVWHETREVVLFCAC